MDDAIAVVGGGIAGASVAYHLGTRVDADVTVFERGALGAETTAKSTAVFRIRDDPVLVSMKRDGLALYNRFLADPTASPSFDLLGRLEVATTEAGAASLEGTDLPTGEYVDGEDLSSHLVFPDLATDAVVGALHNPNAGIFRPVELVHEFVTRARQSGVAFRSNTDVVDVETDGDGVSAVRTADETLPVSHVVAAAGPWNRRIGRLVGLDLPIRHTLAPIVRLEPDPALVHPFPNLKHVESGYYFVGQTDGSVLVGHTPGGYADAGTEYDPDAVPESVPAEVRKGMIDTMADLVPSLLDADVVEEWVGIRSLTPDGRPVLGPTPVDGFSMVGFHSEGIQLAPAAGRVVASQIAGTELPAYAPDVSAARFDDDAFAMDSR